MIVSAIVALAQNHVIGKDNALLWHIPEDFKHFKSTTMGKPMIMGRKTFESLPGLLPGRPHIVISRSGFEAEGTIPAVSIEEAISIAKSITDQDEVFIIGGAQIYTQALEEGYLDRLYLTMIHHDYQGDAHFPEIDYTKWKETQRIDFTNKEPSFSIITYDRA